MGRPKRALPHFPSHERYWNQTGFLWPRWPHGHPCQKINIFLLNNTLHYVHQSVQRSMEDKGVLGIIVRFSDTLQELFQRGFRSIFMVIRETHLSWTIQCVVYPVNGKRVGMQQIEQTDYVFTQAKGIRYCMECFLGKIGGQYYPLHRMCFYR